MGSIMKFFTIRREMNWQPVQIDLRRVNKKYIHNIHIVNNVGNVEILFQIGAALHATKCDNKISFASYEETRETLALFLEIFPYLNQPNAYQAIFEAFNVRPAIKESLMGFPLPLPAIEKIVEKALEEPSKAIKRAMNRDAALQRK